MRFFELCTKIANMVYLSILWLIWCVPIVTIGASTTAYCYMLYKMKNNKEGYIAKGFFKALKENFKQATKVWGILVVMLLILYYDSQVSTVLVNTYGGWYQVIIPVYYLLLFLVCSVILYVFPYMARFDDNVTVTLKNSFLMSTRHLGYTITIMLIDAFILILGLDIFLPIILLAPMLIGIINVSMLNVIFKKYISKSK